MGLIVNYLSLIFLDAQGILRNMFPQVPLGRIRAALQVENSDIDKAVDLILCEQEMSGK